jgi:uncharacterized membrane protein YcaP (DUF421 family)
MGVDWQGLFIPRESLLELFLRGSIMYLSLFVVMRIVGTRHVGSLGVSDLLLIVLIADAAQNGMGEYKSISAGLVLCGTLIFWSHFLDWLAYRFPTLRHWIEPPALEIIHNGRLIRRHLKSEMVSEDELRSQLREHGVEHYNEVKRAFLEPNGQLSIIKAHPSRGDEAQNGPQEKHPR